MTDQNLILLIVALGVIFCVLWTFNARQKRKYEAERLKRKRDLEKLKANTRAAAAEKASD